MLALIWISARC